MKKPDNLSKRRLKMWIRLLGVTRVAESHLREFLRVGHATTLPRFDVMAALAAPTANSATPYRIDGGYTFKIEGFVPVICRATIDGSHVVPSEGVVQQRQLLGAPKRVLVASPRGRPHVDEGDSGGDVPRA